MGRQVGAPAGAIVAVSRIRFAITTRVDEPSDENEDGEHVRERHDEVHGAHGLYVRRSVTCGRNVGVTSNASHIPISSSLPTRLASR